MLGRGQCQIPPPQAAMCPVGGVRPKPAGHPTQPVPASWPGLAKTGLPRCRWGIMAGDALSRNAKGWVLEGPGAHAGHVGYARAQGNQSGPGYSEG